MKMRAFGLYRYGYWLHGRWPARVIERLPRVGPEGETNIAGIRIAGELAGTPLLKFAIQSAVRAVSALASEISSSNPTGGLDLVIVGGGVAGLAGAVEAKRRGLRFEWLEGARLLDTIHGFPKAKPIFAYPEAMMPVGELRLAGELKEDLLAALETQRVHWAIEPRIAKAERVLRDGAEFAVELATGERVRCKKVLIAAGRSGPMRRLGVSGEALPHVRSRLFDPADHRGERVVVVGGGDSACESAAALHDAGADVLLVHRGRDLSRAKVALRAAIEERQITTSMDSKVVAVEEGAVRLRTPRGEQVVRSDIVLLQLGRELGLDLLRRSGIVIEGEWNALKWLSMSLFLLLIFALSLWKSGGALTRYFEERNWFPFWTWIGPDEGPVWRGVQISLEEPGFWFSALYSAVVVGMGVRRMLRRPTPYVRRQTLALISIQLVPLFLLPYFILPTLGHLGVFDSGWGRTFADELFPEVPYGQGREYWRSFGLILAWPLFVWNVWTAQPLPAWLAISLIQTFVIIPLIVYRWGKGAYCGWICSCGALAETLGDPHRTKMPRGKTWNWVNLVGQALLLIAILGFVGRAVYWLAPGSFVARTAGWIARITLQGFTLFGVPLDWKHVVEIVLSSVLGIGLHFWMSGRIWCRFACPLAALMHIYQRAFGRFRIFADKKRCISCARCSAVCHQGIDVMDFAQRGAPMEDPQCVRCSACVQECPTAVLSFGRLGANGEMIRDTLRARVDEARVPKRGLPIVRA